MIKKTIFLLILIILLPGCTVTYNLEISPNEYNESIDVLSNPIAQEQIKEYAIPAFFGIIGYEDVDANFFEKQEGVIYYDSSISEENNLLKINYNYKFEETTINRSNMINSGYETVVIKKYDHNNDGENDYMLFTTNDKFTIFDKFDQIESIQINITNHYEVISSNADKVEKNVYTWYLTKDNIKAINMVYNPDKVVDYRTIWEKFLDGEYFNTFTISILITIIVFILYKIFKNYSEKQNAI